jgi:predicted thioesterase
MKPPSIGRGARFEQVVEARHTADKYGNEGVEVLATPVLCHWFENTSVLAIRSQLESGESTVGTRLTIEHLKPTPIGMRVTVEAEISAVDGRRITFQLVGRDERELIARGTHERYVVDLDRFLARARSKA